MMRPHESILHTRSAKSCWQPQIIIPNATILMQLQVVIMMVLNLIVPYP